MERLLMCLRGKSGNLKKVWSMSKWTLLFVLLGVLNTHGAVYSQNEQRVTLSMKDVYLKDVLWAIESQTTFVFMYNQEDLDRVGKVNVELKTSKIDEILSACLKGTGLTYVIQDAVIVLKPVVQDDKKKNIRIVGTVTDEKKIPLPGVTVMVKGLKIGTATDPKGKYALTLPEMKDVFLVFSFIGMETREVKYTGKDTINVVMKESKQDLEDVIVTGYATVKKSSFTGNTTTVTKDQLLKTNNKSLIAALQTFDPSFRIKENSLWGSDPNSLPEFNIRGESSIGMAKGLDVEYAKRTQRTNLQENPNLPIFILDGFEVSVQKIYDMDMNRIENMTILKDAAATAMYGSRAANGVVVVTTVAPTPGEVRITYNFTGGVELPDLSDYNLCNAEEKLNVEKLSGKFKNDVYGEMEYNKILQNVLKKIDTDWLAQPLRNAFNHKHSLFLEGGVESVRYGLDFNYDSNNGAMKGSYRSRAGAGLSLDFRYKSKIQIRNYVSYNTTRSEDSPYGVFSDYAKMQPYHSRKGEDGKLLKTLDDKTANPLWKTTLASYSGKGQIDDITDNLSVNWFLLDGLQFKGQFSITKTNSSTESFVDPADPEYEKASYSDNEKGYLTIENGNGYNWNVNAMFYYNKEFNKHFINATAGLNITESESSSERMKFVGFQLGSMNTSAYAASQPDKAEVSSSASRLFGILGSLNYSYNNVYLLDASFRLDGSSQFGTDKRFAPFWSVGLGVNIHNYSWLKDNWLINTLRIRGSYGSTGKVNFPSYTAVTTYKIDSDSWYYTGPATSLVYLGNPDLAWETTKTLDAGFAVGFLNDLLYLEANYYNKKTVDLIDEMAIRTSSGFEKYHSNAGSIVNKGFEVKLNATVFRDKNWIIAVTGNLSTNKNEITKLGKATEEYNKKLREEYDAEWPSYGTTFMTTPFVQYRVGASTTAIYAVRSAGIDPANGKEKFIKQGGASTYTWSADDQVVVGDTEPDAKGALGFNLGYKGFFLNVSFLYQWGAQTYNSTLLNKVENANIKTENVDRRVLTERWKRAGDIAPYYDLENTTITKPTSRFVQNYDYLNFSGLSLGYDFKQERIQRIGLNSLGVRFNANDLCRWSTVKEERGISYPYAKNYSFTLNVGF